MQLQQALQHSMAAQAQLAAGPAMQGNQQQLDYDTLPKQFVRKLSVDDLVDQGMPCFPASCTMICHCLSPSLRASSAVACSVAS